MFTKSIYFKAIFSDNSYSFYLYYAKLALKMHNSLLISMSQVKAELCSLQKKLNIEMLARTYFLAARALRLSSLIEKNRENPLWEKDPRKCYSFF